MNALLTDKFSELTVKPSVAVCGFEAFINGKHIIGEVKEKEQAHKEYGEAISQGHGAYLMDEETPVRSFVILRVPCLFSPVLFCGKKIRLLFVCIFAAFGALCFHQRTTKITRLARVLVKVT